MMKNMMIKMTSMEEKIASIEQQTRTLQQVNEKLSMLTARVESSEVMIREVNDKVRGLEGDLQGCSNLFDGIKEKSDKVAGDLEDMNEKIEDMEIRERNMNIQMERLKESLEEKCGELEGKMIDQQCRSMKYNLIFTGIEEVDRYEDSEKVVKDFIATKLKVEGDIPLVNVHRIGNPSVPTRWRRPRPLIAKFLFFKDMMRVKRAGKNLQGTQFGMNEQFPAEVEERRKKLYPIAKAERRKGKKAVLIRDKLYVENELIDPDKYVDRGYRTGSPPRPPPRYHKRARCGSTPDRDDRGANFLMASASTPTVR